MLFLFRYLFIIIQNVFDYIFYIGQRYIRGYVHYIDWTKFYVLIVVYVF
jgi:hypothetical protein